MRLDAIAVRNAPPIHRFEADGLSTVVVIAGPNGVGKTRLLQRIRDFLRSPGVTPDIDGSVTATNAEERAAWSKDSLSLSDARDVVLLQQTLQANQFRRNWKSSVINFESDRSIQALKPMQWSWDLPDPEKEEIGWDYAFGYMRDRFQDTVHSMFRMIEAQKQSIANRAIDLRRGGHSEMQLRFDDPMDPFKELFHQLLAPKTLMDPSARQQRLEYDVNGQVFDVLTTLSSGEREVVNIAFDFLLRRPRDCIVFFDEPELHLHPELSYKLIQALQGIGAANQFFLSTHSPDIITASLDHSVLFVAPPKVADIGGTPPNQAIPVSETDDTNQALRLLGQSVGIIALGKKLVLVEGDSSSLDKRVYGSILADRFPGLVLVPSGGRHTLESFETVYEQVLSRTVWGVDFYMLCDGDAAPVESPTQKAAAETAGRLRVLPRYHLENYFLDASVWAAAFSQLEPDGSALRDAIAVREMLLSDARTLVSYAASLRAAAEIRRLTGNVDVMPRDCHGKEATELVALFETSASIERDRLGAFLDTSFVAECVERHYQEVLESLDADDDTWMTLIPGKPLLGMFAGRTGMKLGRLKTMYLHTAESPGLDPFEEVISIFEGFAA